MRYLHTEVSVYFRMFRKAADVVSRKPKPSTLWSCNQMSKRNSASDTNRSYRSTPAPFFRSKPQTKPILALLAELAKNRIMASRNRCRFTLAM